MTRRSLDRRTQRLAARLGGAPDLQRDDRQRNVATVRRGLSDLANWIASDYRELPPEERRPGHLGRVRAMIDAARELIAAPVLGELLANGFDDPADLSSTSMFEALRANRWLHEEQNFPAVDFLGIGEPSPADAELTERRAAAAAPLPDDAMPSGWLELSAQLALLDAENHPRVIGPETEPPLELRAYL